MEPKKYYGEYQDEEKQLLAKNPAQKQQHAINKKIIYYNKKSQHNNNNNNQNVNRKQRAIQGFIVVLITILFCFSALFLLHTHDKQHTKLTSNTFLQNSLSFLSKNTNIEIKKPLTDNREYKYLVLENDLKVLLVHDQKATQAAASLDVKTGSWNEPDDWPGLAHFLEHMEFQSTEKKLDDILSINQGMSNAYTSTENTNYYLSVSPSALNETLEIFAEMFNNPVFKKENVERESSAVNGEYEIDISLDGWKMQNLISLISNESHPASRFTIGNTETLRKDGVVDALNEYFENHYSSNLMTLVITSPDPIKDIEHAVQQAGFNQIQNKNINQTDFSQYGNLLNEDYLGHILKLQINSEEKFLTLMTQTNHLNNSPEKNGLSYVDYIFHNLQNQEANGFLDLLLMGDLVEDLDFGLSHESNTFAIFVIEFQLTQKGLQNIDEVLIIYNTALRKILHEGINQELYEQRAQQHLISYNYSSSDVEIQDKVSDISSLLNNVKEPCNVLLQPYVYQSFDEEKIEEIIHDLMDPTKQIFIVSKNFHQQEDEDQGSSNNNQQQQQEQGFTSMIQKRLKTRHSTSHKSKNTKKSLKKNNILTKNFKHKKLTSTQVKTQLKLHNDFLNKQTLEKYDELYNLEWDHIKFGKQGLQRLTEINEHFYQHLQLPELNMYIPHNFDMVSLCQDDSFALDLSYQLQSIFSGSEPQQNHHQNQNSNQQQNDNNQDIYSQNNGYDRFIYEAFETDNLTDTEKCVIEEIQYEHDHKYPQLLKDDHRGRLFYKLDREFQIPKVTFLSNLISNQISRSPKSTLQLQIFNYIFSNKIQQIFQQPINADYQIVIQASQIGIQVYISGWSEHFSEVVSKVFIALQELEITEDEEVMAKEYIQASLKQHRTLNPLQQALHVKLNEFLVKPHTSYQEYLELLKEIKLDDIHKIQQDLLYSFKMDSMILGNIKQKEVEILYENISSLFSDSFLDLQQQEQELQHIKVANLKGKSYVQRIFSEGPEEDLNSATINYYQFGEQTMQSNLAMSLMENILHSFFFQYLRTDRELGYQAFARIKPIGCVKAFIIGVQGSKEAPDVVDGIIEQGLKDFEQFLIDMDGETFKTLQEGSQQDFSLNFSSLEEKASFYFSYISQGNFAFDEFDLLRNVYSPQITKTTFLQFFEDMFKNNSAKLSVQIFSKANYEELPEDLLEKDSTFAQQQPYFINNPDDLHSQQNDYICTYQFQYE